MSQSSTQTGGASAAHAPRRVRSVKHEAWPQPRCHVILWDSDQHMSAYVAKMLRDLFDRTKEACCHIATTVDVCGRAVVITTSREHAELKCEQIHAYGSDHLESFQGSMWATLEEV